MIAADLHVRRFLVLFRHLCWLLDQRIPRNRGVRGRDGYVQEHTVVMDGTMVCLSNRHAYLAGRKHTTVPAWSTSRTKTAPFKDRLLIPDRRHRAALAALLHAAPGDKGVLCNDACLSLVQWLQDESCDQDRRPMGGYFLAPYISITMFTAAGRATTALRAGLTTLKLTRECVRLYGTAIRHWSSNSPEIQVLPWPLAQEVRTWLERESLVPVTGLDAVVHHSEHVQALLMADATTNGQEFRGDFWRLSDDLTELLTQMTRVVEDTCEEETEEIPARDTVDRQREDEAACTYTPPGHRTQPTDFERFLWVRTPGASLVGCHAMFSEAAH